MVLGEAEIKKLSNSIVDIERSENVTFADVWRQINPASIDLTIGAQYYKAKNFISSVTYGLQDENEVRKYTSDLYWYIKNANDNNGFIELLPGDAVLAVTREYINMPNGVCGQIFTKSTLGRMFINHMMAGFVDPGFHGRLTLELVNDGCHTIKIPVGARIVQMILSEVIGSGFYYGRYQGAETLECAKVMK